MGFISHVIYANIWQVVLSLVYLAYNALLTCMVVGDEWSRFASRRKLLRVTHPRGIQRSTYFISMPYRYGVPLMIANTVLHIMISQSLFIVSTITFLPNLIEVPETSYTVAGYSFSAIVICKLILCFLKLTLTKYRSSLCWYQYYASSLLHILLQCVE
jgi:hypothetical protein